MSIEVISATDVIGIGTPGGGGSGGGAAKGALIFKGSVATYADLPENPQNGWVYNIETADPTHGIDAGDNVAWVATDGGGYWDDLGGTVDLSAYLTKEEAASTYATKTELATKQDTLVSGTNIKTINNESILGSGNLSITTNFLFDSSWPTNTTFTAFLTAVNNDSNAVVGMTYLGELTCSGLPTGINNAEAIVEILPSTVSPYKAIHVVLTSGNVSPYRWEYTYWAGGNGQSGWKTWQPEITISNKLSADLVDDTSTTNKFVTAADKTNWNSKTTVTIDVWEDEEV